MVNQDFDAILDAALKLPSEQRLDMVDRLWASLENDDALPLDAATAAELDRRIQAVENGETELLPGDPILRKLESGERP